VTMIVGVGVVKDFIRKLIVCFRLVAQMNVRCLSY
jgi:hypothetical protein